MSYLSCYFIPDPNRDFESELHAAPIPARALHCFTSIYVSHLNQPIGLQKYSQIWMRQLNCPTALNGHSREGLYPSRVCEASI
jgi:hypothetical protein